MYLKLTSILLLMLFVSCKWWYKAEAEVEIKLKVVKEDPVVVAEKAAEEVSKATGKGVEEVKTLSKEELDKIAKEVKDDAEKVLQDTRNASNNIANAKKTSELIKEIKESAEKFELAFKTLVGAGYTGDVVDPVMGNMSRGLKNLPLLEQLAGIVENNGRREDAEKAVKAFGGDKGSCLSSLNERGYAQNKGSKECINSLMERINSTFNGGVHNLLRDALSTAPEKFKAPLGALRQAANDISTAAGIIKYSI
ncbi:hypothetical protein [Borrelia sp. RT1S]|uniref:hypothetical protein n=1 Tax=Borrelia sp. RT1S TaxID=2898580 RepID=UPI001E4B1E6B|nr:hypothetical protein [Borrelia sp. RT1S]UGQ18015.1 hypothetical protein LSO05_06160 [Borrelia sp. RT1S]